MKPVSSETMSLASSGASRRGFLGLLGGALIAAGASSPPKQPPAAPLTNAITPAEGSTIAAPASTSPALRPVVATRGIFIMPDHLSLDAFSAQLDTPFHVPDANIALELVKATDTSRGDNVRSFQLIMRGPSEPLLAPDTHVLHHATMGEMAVFLSPLSKMTKERCTTFRLAT